MRMNQDERRFDFHGLGLALKQAREEKGWTQAYVAELVGKTDRTIMNIENKGQHPSFNLFFKLVTLFDISVDQFFYTEGQRGENSCRKNIDVLLSLMNEKELVVMEATDRRLKKARWNGGSRGMAVLRQQYVLVEAIQAWIALLKENQINPLE